MREIGPIPKENFEKRRLRLHQAWWRMNVLNEECGIHPLDNSKNVCSSILDGEKTFNNFITENVRTAVRETLGSRISHSSGIIEKERLFNNLLSSQPLCFNFFGEFFVDKVLGLKCLQLWWPEVTHLDQVIFEFAPKGKYTGDNSAFDVAFDVMFGEKKGLIGLECKYTDSFSPTQYSKDTYQKLFNNCNAFTETYQNLTDSRYNQLFRNQLVAESLKQNNEYEIVKTGLFCYHSDAFALKVAGEFKEMLKDPEIFKIITYKEFISEIQKLELTWSQREWTMLLWARYFAMNLSEATIKQVEFLK